MLKKIVVGLIVTLLSGGLIYGAINRTQAKSEQASNETPSRQYANRNEPQTSSTDEDGERSGQNMQREFGKNNEDQRSQVEEIVQSRGNERVGAAEVSEWVSIFGTVLEVSEDAILVLTDQGDELVLEGMTLRYTQEQGFYTSNGSTVRLLGFYENGEFEIGEMVDLSSGLVVAVREESGRPLWAGGRGRRGL
jgi:hypothetical protein